MYRISPNHLTAMKCLFSLLTILFATVALATPPQLDSLKQAEKLYLTGLQAQRDNDRKTAHEAWNQAAEIYRQELDQENFDNAGLRFNLANVYLAQHELGKAIHQYRKALKLEPDNPDIIANLNLAREQCKDTYAQPETDRVLKTLFAFHYDLSYGTRKWLFIITYVTCFALIAARILVGKKAALHIAIAISACLAIVCTLSLAVSWHQNAKTRGVIVTKIVHAKTGSSNDYQDAFEKPLHDGSEFILVETDDSHQWLHVKLENGQTCWIPAHAACIH